MNLDDTTLSILKANAEGIEGMRLQQAERHLYSLVEASNRAQLGFFGFRDKTLGHEYPLTPEAAAELGKLATHLTTLAWEAMQILHSLSLSPELTMSIQREVLKPHQEVLDMGASVNAQLYAKRLLSTT